jgi:hypothetical protein
MILSCSFPPVFLSACLLKTEREKGLREGLTDLHLGILEQIPNLVILFFPMISFLFCGLEVEHRRGGRGRCRTFQVGVVIFLPALEGRGKEDGMSGGRVADDEKCRLFMVVKYSP